MLAGKPDEAKKHFETLRVTAGSLDTNVPISQRIDAIAKEFGAPLPWRRPEAPRTDSGKRPAMESLGPVHWTPFSAAPFTLPDESNHPVSLSDFSGKPVVVLFYLSRHCTHCMEQLKAFSTAADDFKKAGLEIVAIGSEEAMDLTATADTCRPGDATKQNAIHLLATRSSWSSANGAATTTSRACPSTEPSSWMEPVRSAGWMSVQIPSRTPSS